MTTVTMNANINVDICSIPSKFQMLMSDGMKKKYVEQRTIFRRGHHISPHFPIMDFDVLVQIVTISLKVLSTNVCKFHRHKRKKEFVARPID